MKICVNHFVFKSLQILLIAFFLSGCVSPTVGEPTTSAFDSVLQQLESASSIKRLQRAYGYYLDAGQWDEAADLFSNEARIEISQHGVYQGKARIREFLYALNGGISGLRPGQLNEHTQLQPVIHVSTDGKTAKGRWRDFGILGQYKEQAVWSEGIYENEYIKEDGVWKIASLHWYETFTADYDGGWVANESTPALRLKNLTPDSPPTQVYKSWPEVYIAPYHYEDADGSNTIDLAKGSLSNEKGLVTRLQRLNDVSTLENLIAIYGYYLDKNQWDKAIALFAEDSTAEIAQHGIYRGRQRIQQMLESFGPQGLRSGHLNNHMQAQPVIHVSDDGEQAWVRYRTIIQNGVFGSTGLNGDAVYENEFVKLDGQWKIRRVHMYPTFLSQYGENFTVATASKFVDGEKLAADEPSNAAYAAFPNTSVTPFHYAHPVTGKAIYNTEPVYKKGIVTSQKNENVSSLPSELEQRITRLEDERAVEALQHTYGYLVDKAMWRETADLFSKEGTLEIGGRGIFVGPDRIYTYFNFLGPEGPINGRLINHMQLQPLVTIAPDGKTAKLRARFVAQGGDSRKADTIADDSPGVPHNSYFGMGNYENEFVKEDGVWKINKLYAAFRMYTFVLEGWAKIALPLTLPEANLPSDYPPSASYSTYPNTYITPYHYKNPVTNK